MNVVDLIKSIPDVIVGSGASDKEIDKAEKALELNFADDYKECLHSFGAVMFDGHELSGISKAKQSNVVELTSSEKSYHADIPEDMYVIENLDIDGIVIWQDTKGTIYEMQNGKYKKINKSLADYIKEVIFLI